jgi:trans-L-3-hydroxyproline dehydratase
MLFEASFIDSSKFIETIEMHTGGEPLRIIQKGLPPIPGKTIIDKINYFKQHYDHIRKGLMWEPRGHADMYGAILTEPVSMGSDFGVFFMHNEGYSTMCGHAIIAIATLKANTLALSGSGTKEFRIDVPSGTVTAKIKYQDSQVSKVSFVNVPSFVFSTGNLMILDDVGEISFDIAFGGAFYAYIDADKLGIELSPENSKKLIETGRSVKEKIVQAYDIIHPVNPSLSFLYGVIFYGKPLDSRFESRNVCIFADGELDRSATGTGVSGKAALLYKNGRISIDECIEIESIIGSTMTVSVLKTTSVGHYEAVIPVVSGSAFITGFNKFYFDPLDPFNEGFFIR